MKPQSAIAIKDSHQPLPSNSVLPMQALEEQVTQRSQLLSAYRLLREGKITTEKFKTMLPSPSIMKSWRQLGTDEEIMTVIAMMFEIWPARRDASPITPFIWLRGIRKQPLLSIYEAFIRITEHPNKWRPDPGTFAAEVRRHALATETVIFNSTDNEGAGT